MLRRDPPVSTGAEDVYRKVLGDALGSQLDYYSEYIDERRFGKPQYRSALRAYLRSRYSQYQFNLVIAAGAPALHLIRETDDDLFPGVPIVFDLPEDTSGEPHSTGVVSAFDTTGTLRLALALHPGTKRVAVVAGASSFDRTWGELARAQFQAFDHVLSFEYLYGLPIADLERTIAALPRESIVYYMNVSEDGDGHPLVSADVLARLAALSPVPIYGFDVAQLGRGIVGGRLFSTHVAASHTANLALRVLAGETPESIPVAKIDPSVTEFDWRQLRRWGISAAALPAGSVTLFREPGTWELRPGYIGAAIVVVFLQSTLLGSLLIQAVRRRRAEEQTRKSEDRYRSVVETQSELICRFLPDSTLTFVNDAYCRFWGKTEGELLGTKFVELIPPTARQAVLERIGRIRNGFDSHEHQVMLPDGTVGWHHWINHAIIDERGALIELQGVGRDITDRARAVEAVSQLEARNSAILRAIPDLMFVLLRDGTYVDYHARDPKRLFVPPEEFIGKTVRDIMPPPLVETFMNALEEASASRDPVVVEYELATDEVRHFEARLVNAEHGRVLSMVRDVTDAKRAQALNRDLARRLIVSQEVERQRIARELHDDLSQKIALLNIEIEQLAGHLQSGEARARLRHLSLRAGEIATDVHNLSHELHPSKLQTLGLAAAIQSMCRDVGQQFGLDVAFTADVLPESIAPNVSLCLYRIAQEALHNVARHSHARQAALRLACDGDMLSLQIADSGIGFDSRAHHAGLGLVSMRERVGLAKGQLVIHTAPGGGVRIGARVPLASPAHDEAPAPNAARVSRFEEAV